MKTGHQGTKPLYNIDPEKLGIGRLVSDHHQDTVSNCLETVETLLDQRSNLEASLKGHQAIMRQLERVHDSQLGPYCTLLKERIESTIVPVIEDAIVAVQILIELDGNVVATLLEGLRRRIKLGLEHPPYVGGDFSGA